jgi:uncharacterized SAM-binding protein YcdF (DUF218 family)
MPSVTLPLSRLVDPTVVLLLTIAAGLWLSRGRAAGARLDDDPGAQADPGAHLPQARIARLFRQLAARRARLGRTLAWAACGALWLLATPAVASLIARAVSERPRDLGPDLAGSAPERRALVVLGASIDPDEGGVPAMERLSDAAMERCIGAARVYHAHGFRWVIVTGTHADRSPEEMGRGMVELLAALGVPRERILVESEALDTKQNALFSARIIRDLGAERAVLVTSALHMRRAVSHFERAGLQVIPAPVKLDPRPVWTLEGLVPSARSLRRSQRAVHEILGRLEP